MKIVTSGESHGKGLFAILEGFPAGVKIDVEAIDRALALRQSGFGRGARQNIEHDHAEILSGVRNSVTLGSPITVTVFNRDYENWRPYMAPEGCDITQRKLTKVRPGHADLAGMLKFGQTDARNVLERASARETAVRVAAGEICRQLLAALGVRIGGYVLSVGSIRDEATYSFAQLAERETTLGMMNESLAARAREEIQSCRREGDTLGGIAEVRVKGLKSGFGSCMTYSEKLDARLGAAVFSIQAVKGVEFGMGFASSAHRGSEVHDEIFPSEHGPIRASNRAGGIEGGMSNGEEIVLRAAMKPIPTLMRGLRTVDTETGEASIAAAERSDVCAILAFETVVEAVVATEIAMVVADRLGGDTLADLAERYERLPA